jgi:hypothetical protein
MHNKNIRLLRAIVLLFACSFTAGCSLFSFESPAKPLPQRDLNARMLTREYAGHFMTSVVQAADDITAKSTDPAVALAALRWKIGATAASQRAATQQAPMMGLLDTWALSAQMREYLGAGAGATLFGDQQSTAQGVATVLEQEIVRLAQSLTNAKEFASYQQFVADYVRDHALTNADFVRASVVDLWVTQTGQQATLLSTLGTAPEAMSDVADRMRLLGEQVPAQSIWKTELALRDSGYGQEDFHAALKKLDERLATISKLADTSPEMVHDAIADLRKSMLEVADKFDKSLATMMDSLSAERAALADNVRDERAVLVTAVDAQRALAMKDAERIAVRVTETSWQHIRVLVRELAFWGLLFVIVLLGLPFAAGYFIGRARAQRSISSGRTPSP